MDYELNYESPSECGDQSTYVDSDSELSDLTELSDEDDITTSRYISMERLNSWYFNEIAPAIDPYIIPSQIEIIVNPRRRRSARILTNQNIYTYTINMNSNE